MSTANQVAPSVVAQRLCDLLLQFPAASIGGVQWRTLSRKYEERYTARLDVVALGFSSALTAATTLLWDVLRVVDGEDVDNPVLAVEDGVALTPRPGSMGSWPSLYKALCEVVLSNGSTEVNQTAEADASGGTAGPTYALLLSQLKQLLQVQWHANFDETCLGYLSEEGTFLKVKKMKHLVNAVIRWRDLRVQWREANAGKLCALDDALFPHLELVASKKHNDLILRCFPQAPKASPAPVCHGGAPDAAAGKPSEAPSKAAGGARRAQQSHPNIQVPTFDMSVEQQNQSLQHEVDLLRAENGQLRSENEQLLREHECQSSSICSSLPLPLQHRLPSEVSSIVSEDEDAAPPRVVEVFDDPFEPPPQKQQWGMRSPASTFANSDFLASTSCGTPMSPACFSIHSGSTSRASMTPIPHFDIHSGAPSGTMTPSGPINEESSKHSGSAVCAFVPVWFNVIPTGIVSRFRNQFESTTEPGNVPVPPTPMWAAPRRG
mmetsp:Transcript_20060/g.36250  ORF Transcript_20060/g.36250 Transcript_20060/m.36250 type:complete len:492 (-) Transcript_20060:108-1583(-)